ncbi:MAG: hypothetical protein V1661_01805 [bacterium]
MEGAEMKKYSWKMFDSDCEKIAERLKNANYKNIFGIPRGGLMVAIRLSYFLSIPLILETEKIEKETLVMDDICDSGKTILKLRDLLGFMPDFISIFNKGQPYPIYYCRDTDEWVVFPWETEASSKYDGTF